MEVKISEAALRDVDELPAPMQVRVHAVAERLGKWPNVSGVKTLTGNCVCIERVAHRREVYD